jgi:hypothetical protein
VLVLGVLLADVLREIGLRIALEKIREIEGDAHPQPPGRLARQRPAELRHRPDEQHRLHDEHRRQERHDADCDAPIETAVPGGGHGQSGVRD